MRKLKILWVTLLGLFFAAFLLFEYIDETIPEGVEGAAADALAARMLTSINDQNWKKTGAVSWRYDDRTHIWDRNRHFAQVNFNNYTVLIDINNRLGMILKGGGEQASEEQKTEICEWAWKYWGNDSYWLNPVSKIFDPGTIRKLVARDDGSDALLVTYTSGGATPGDSYLWMLDETGRPKAWKFWVSIIPVGGMKFTWDQWITLDTGAKISTSHFNPLKTIEIYDPKAAFTLVELVDSDIFTPLLVNRDSLIKY